MLCVMLSIYSKARYCKHYPEGPKDPKVILKTVRILRILRFILPIICHVPGSLGSFYPLVTMYQEHFMLLVFLEILVLLINRGSSRSFNP